MWVGKGEGKGRKAEIGRVKRRGVIYEEKKRQSQK
jgi:hypothetical protein